MESKVSILAPFFEEPNRQFHIREVAKIIGISHAAVRKHLKQLEKEGYLILKETKPYKTYKPNVSTRKYQNFKLYYNLEKITKSGIMEHFEKFYDYPTIILFGSYVQAMDDEKSDIDFCIISEVKGYPELEAYEKRLRRRVSIHLYDKNKWKQAKLKNPELINSICNSFVLSGQLEIL